MNGLLGGGRAVGSRVGMRDTFVTVATASTDQQGLGRGGRPGSRGCLPPRLPAGGPRHRTGPVHICSCAGDAGCLSCLSSPTLVAPHCDPRGWWPSASVGRTWRFLVLKAGAAASRKGSELETPSPSWPPLTRQQHEKLNKTPLQPNSSLSCVRRGGGHGGGVGDQEGPGR